jgi:hypothetical protein
MFEVALAQGHRRPRSGDGVVTLRSPWEDVELVGADLPYRPSNFVSGLESTPVRFATTSPEPRT